MSHQKVYVRIEMESLKLAIIFEDFRSPVAVY